MRSITGDVGDLAALKSALHESGAEVVIHMAAQRWSVRHATIGPDLRHQRHGHRAPARAAPREGARVIVVSSDKCYENREWHWPCAKPIPWAAAILPSSKAAQRW